jgi:hypothetical protein
VTFAEAVDALKALADEGIVVEATVWGKEDDSYELASLGGLLVYAPGDPEVLGALAGELLDAVAAAEIATVFEVGSSDFSHTIDLWPSRFISAEVDDINGVQIVTRDGRLQVRKNRPWID